MLPDNNDFGSSLFDDIFDSVKNERDQLSINDMKCTLQVRDAYEFAWEWVQYTRPVPPRKTSVRCSVHAALRCNRNGNQTAYGILWVRVNECQCATLQEAIELFMPKIKAI